MPSGFKAFIPRKLEIFLHGRSSDLHHPWNVLPILFRTVVYEFCPMTSLMLTAAGPVQDFHLIPFYNDNRMA